MPEMLDCVLTDTSTGEIITISPLDLCCRWVKHECPDGHYTIHSHGSDEVRLAMERRDGIVYPLSGVIPKPIQLELAQALGLRPDGRRLDGN
jgi:hypothetical protein